MTNKELELEHAKVEHLIDTITKPLYKRINELENIINELKKWLEYEIYCDFSNEMTKAYQDSLDKLKELKENK